jgi:hypothetical protein
VPQATMSSLDAILKEVYSVRTAEQLNTEITVTKRLEKTSEGVVETVGGKYVDFPIHIGRNHGVGSRKENEALPAAKAQQYTEVHVPLTYSYGVFRVTGQLIELADSNQQAFVSALDNEMNRLKDDVRFDYERQIFGDGTGLLASVTADGANTVTVDSVASLEIGMQIDIRTRSNGAAVISNREITDINGLVVTYDGADGAATATEGLYREGNYASGLARELSGFASIFSTSSTLHTVNPGTAAGRKWAAVVNSNGGTPRALSEGLMITLVDEVRKQGGGTPTVLFSNLGVRRSYFNLLVQQRRYTNTKEFEGGFSGLAFTTDNGEIPMVADYDCLPNRIFAVNEKELKIYEAGDWSFMNRDGSNWQRVITSAGAFDAYSCTLYKYMELGTHRRNAHGLLSDITEG